MLASGPLALDIAFNVCGESALDRCQAEESQRKHGELIKEVFDMG